MDSDHTINRTIASEGMRYVSVSVQSNHYKNKMRPLSARARPWPMALTAAGLTYWFFQRLVQASFCKVSPCQRLFSTLALFTCIGQSNSVITLSHLFCTASQRSAAAWQAEHNSIWSCHVFNVQQALRSSPLLRWRAALKSCIFSTFWIVYLHITATNGC